MTQNRIGQTRILFQMFIITGLYDQILKGELERKKSNSQHYRWMIEYGSKEKQVFSVIQFWFGVGLKQVVYNMLLTQS